MENKEVWYTIEKRNNIWIVWRNVDKKHGDMGVIGSRRLFSSIKRIDCVNWCKDNNIKTSRKR